MESAQCRYCNVSSEQVTVPWRHFINADLLANKLRPGMRNCLLLGFSFCFCFGGSSGEVIRNWVASKCCHDSVVLDLEMTAHLKVDGFVIMLMEG